MKFPGFVARAPAAVAAGADARVTVDGVGASVQMGTQRIGGCLCFVMMESGGYAVYNEQALCCLFA